MHSKKSRIGVEVWRDVAGYENLYRVSNLGRVFSVTRAVPHARYGMQKIQGRLMSTQPDANGYLVVTLCRNSCPRRCYVHHIMLEAFCGLQPPAAHTRHLNGDPSDCRLFNVAYGSVSRNQRDRVVHGTSNRGTANGNARLDEDKVRRIKRIISKNPTITSVDLGVMFGVSRQCINGIKSGTNWGYVTL